MLRVTIAGLLIIASVSPSLAGSDDAIVQLIKQGVASPDPIPAVFQGIASLPDTDLDGASVEAALKAGGVPEGSVLMSLLGGLTELKKTGSTIEIKRASPVVVPIVTQGATQGFVSLGKDVTFNVTKSGSTVSLDQAKGASVGTAADALHNLSGLVFNDGPSPTLTINATWLMFSKSVTIPLPAASAPEDAGLPPPSPPAGLHPTATRPAATTTQPSTGEVAPPSQTHGLAGALGP
jgi:hypothetical protein